MYLITLVTLITLITLCLHLACMLKFLDSLIKLLFIYYLFTQKSHQCPADPEMAIKILKQSFFFLTRYVDVFIKTKLLAIVSF